MRIANGQPGCEPEELAGLINVLDKKLHLPEFLDGTTNIDLDNVWELYISETIYNIYQFMIKVNLILHGGYLCVTLVIAVFVQLRYKKGGFNVVSSASFLRIIIAHSIIVGITILFMSNFRKSDWAIGISSGNTLRRPFPPSIAAEEVDKVEGKGGLAGWLVEGIDPTISQGLTVMPSRRDVLVGTRYDTKTIGSYSRWLDYHPGNEAFLEDITNRMMMVKGSGATGVGGAGGGRSLYRSYEIGLPPIFHRWIIQSVITNIEKYDGRFLQQDYRTGDWKLMDEIETRDYVRLILTSGTNGAVSAEVLREINFLLGTYRFGNSRGTGLARHSQMYLHHLTKTIFGTLPQVSEEQKKTQLCAFTVTSMLPPNTTRNEEVRFDATIPTSRRWTQLRSEPTSDIRIGSSVVYTGFKGKQFAATVVNVNEKFDSFEIVFPADETHVTGLGKFNVPRDMLFKPLPPVEGYSVQANYKGEGQWFPGYITKVRPSGVYVEYDDGDHEGDIPLFDIRVVESEP